MDFKRTVADLMNAGYTQQDLATACECSQPTISAIKTGDTKDPKGSIALKLAELHQQISRRKPQARAA